MGGFLEQVTSARVVHKADLRAAIQTMLETPGPYLLDVIVPHQVGGADWHEFMWQLGHIDI